MSDWQPIETAPKDGTWVLLYDGRYVTGFYSERAGEWYNGFASEIDGDPIEESPTHWQHLPAPPELP